jgi:hypothetical protein
MVKRELGMDPAASDSSDDALLSQMITEYSLAIQKYCRRIFVQEGITQHYWPTDYYACLKSPGDAFILTRRPIAQITSMVVDGSEIDLTKILKSDKNGLVYRRNDNGDPLAWNLCRIAKIEYLGGFLFEDIPPDIQRAAMVWVKEAHINIAENSRLKSEQNYNVGTWVWQDRSAGSSTSTGGLPEETYALLKPYREPIDVL